MNCALEECLVLSPTTHKRPNQWRLRDDLQWELFALITIIVLGTSGGISALFP